MSCRVLKRGMEDAMMDTVVADAAARGVKDHPQAIIIPPAKNAMVREFYAQVLALPETAEDDRGRHHRLARWTSPPTTPKHPHMKIER